MNNIQQVNLKCNFIELKRSLLDFIKLNNSKFDEEDFRAYYYILKTIDKIISELNSESMLPKDKRYAVLSRTVIELSPSIMDPDLGGKIIKLENEYINI